MRLAIIGSGELAEIMGRIWARCGHQVLFGVEHPESSDAKKRLARVGDNVRVLSAYDAAGADLIVLTGDADLASDVIESLGDLEGRVLLDCTAGPGRAEGVESTVEALETHAINARVVGSFQTEAWRALDDSQRSEVRPSLFLCGDEAESLDVVGELVHELGLEPIPAGPLSRARLLESMQCSQAIAATVLGCAIGALGPVGLA